MDIAGKSPCGSMSAADESRHRTLPPPFPITTEKKAYRYQSGPPTRSLPPPPFLRAFICLLALTTNYKSVGAVGERRGGKIPAQLREDHHLCDRLIGRLYCKVEQALVFGVVTNHLISLHALPAPDRSTVPSIRFRMPILFTDLQPSPLTA
jgi:hypothetical protein